MFVAISSAMSLLVFLDMLMQSTVVSVAMSVAVSVAVSAEVFVVGLSQQIMLPHLQS